MNPMTPTFAEALHFWVKLGFISFGGPTGQIAIMHSELVERRRWLGEAQFLHALNFCMLLPGPEAQQLAIYSGWLLHGTRGGIAAGALFVLPAVLILWALSAIYASLGSVPLVAAVFQGLQPAVIAIVAASILRIGRRALKTWVMWALAVLAFVLIRFAGVPFPLIVLGAGLVGYFGGRWLPRHFAANTGHGSDATQPDLPLAAPPSLARSLKVLLVCGALWWLPILALGRWLGWDSVPYRSGVFFSQTALVTFGGAYAVLPYVAQHAVQTLGWLTHADMMAGMGLAETTPGPLIMVLQFVGYIAAFKNPGTLPPMVAGTVGALISTWATFVPCFMWIFLGAPYVERLRGDTRLGSALSTITASVVGVILNLALWFGVSAILPAGRPADLFVAVVAATAFVGMARFKWDIIPVVLVCAALGVVRMFASGVA